MGIVDRVVAALKTHISNFSQPTSEDGHRPTPESSMAYLYRQMWVDPVQRAAIMDIRDMDRTDGRVKRIHARVARDTIKGGLSFTQTGGNNSLAKKWKAYARRLQLNRTEKLKSDARGLIMEGSLPLQWVLDEAMNVVAGIRMPAETIVPRVNVNGRFIDPADAYWQLDAMTGKKLAAFPLWRMFMCRLDPENFDDMGSVGRPFLDASRATWRKLVMTEEDLVIRRRVRAPLRLAHVLEGATKAEIDTYRAEVERDSHEITTDYYLNRKGGVSPIQGDSNLDQIRDVVHLLDSFFSGSPMPKGLVGYSDGLSRDILEDIKRDYYEEVDLIQDTLAFAYEAGFRLQLLLEGIDPDNEEFTIKFAERRTETANQTTDRMLKYSALGLPDDLIYEEMGFNPEDIRKRKEEQAKNGDPYPGPDKFVIAPREPGLRTSVPKVSVTPGNAPKGESATSIATK